MDPKIVSSTLSSKLNLFITSCLQNILRIRCQRKARTETCGHEPDKIPSHRKLPEKKRRWIGHTLRKPSTNLFRRVMD